MILFWLLPLAVVLHIVEEFIFPGGFTSWYRNYKEHYAASATSRYLITVNVILIVLCILPLFLEPRNAVSLWLSIASIVFFNAIFHIQALIRSRKYSPGVVTSVLFYIPLAAYGYWFFISSQSVSISQALVSSTFGIVYLLFSVYNHKRRARNLPIA